MDFVLLGFATAMGTANDCDCKPAKSAADNGVRTQWAIVGRADKKHWACCYCGRSWERAIKANAELSQMIPFTPPKT